MNGLVNALSELVLVINTEPSADNRDNVIFKHLGNLQLVEGLLVQDTELLSRLWLVAKLTVVGCLVGQLAEGIARHGLI